MSSSVITIQVLAYSDLFQYVLNFIATFMKGSEFQTLLKLTTLISIIMLMTGFVKRHDPLDFVRWLLAWVLITNVIILPKTTVYIQEASLQNPKIVDNVPLVFALSSSLITTVGFSLAHSFDALLALPDDLRYTSTGLLFGSQMVQASKDFRIINPKLKEEMDGFFRSCVVGDIRINRKYSLDELEKSDNIWSKITENASPLRMTVVNGKPVTCVEASKSEGEYSLYLKLQKELKNAYTFFGINIFGKPHQTTYEALFATHLSSAFNYYQNMTDSSANIFLQAMMINHIESSIDNYKAFTDSSAGILNHQFTKTQMQHRWSWQIAGLKAAWFLPLLHTILTLLLFGIFPILIALGLLPSGSNMLKGYIQFLVSLQLWPLMFAILNLIMTLYGQSLSSNHGAISMINIDKIDELHADISGVAGYLMLSIPFIANGIVGRLGDAFNGLATSMTGHMQNSATAIAGEVTNASFSLGQNSFYNTSANNFSANKHDSNWTNFHGLHTEQMDTGVLKTSTPSGEVVYDVTPGMSKTPIGIADSHALSASLSKAYDSSMQAAQNESEHFQKSLSSFAHKATQFSSLSGHDLRLGDGVSSNTSAQIQSSFNTMEHIATDVAHKLGMSKEGAFTILSTQSSNVNGGLSIDVMGVKAGAEASLKAESSQSLTKRYSDDVSGTISGKEAHDFNQAFSEFKQLTQNHHFDETSSKGASLLNQMGTDLRESLNASHNYDANLSKAQRISEAKSFVETHGEQVTTDLNQAFQHYVGSHVDEHTKDALFSHPGDMNALSQLQTYANDFIHQKQEALIETYGRGHEASVSQFYQEGVKQVGSLQNMVKSHFKDETQKIMQTPEVTPLKNLPLKDGSLPEGLSNNITQGMNDIQGVISKGKAAINAGQKNLMNVANSKVKG